MGAIAPVATTLTSILGAVSAVNQVVNTVQTLSGNSPRQQEQDLALRQLQERQKLDAQKLAQNNALEREQRTLEAEQDAEDRRAALRRAVARQKANFGARGISQGGGSSQAVLLGLFDETEEELAEREALDNLRNRALDLGEAQNRSLNLLQATQLSQSQKLDREINGLGRIF